MFMGREVNLKTLVAIIVIGGLVFGFFLYYVANIFTDNMTDYFAPIPQEQSYLNSTK